jgi:hypothetical protein
MRSVFAMNGLLHPRCKRGRGGVWFYEFIKTVNYLIFLHKNQSHTTNATAVLVRCFKIYGNKGIHNLLFVRTNIKAVQTPLLYYVFCFNFF